jgi:succinylglutamate desuccinylase
MKKKTLIIGGTHGDEPIGIRAIKKLSVGRFDWLIGNPIALKNNKRFYQKDLNRSAPGDLQSNVYEVRRAAEIIARSKKYQYTIDLHGTKKNTGVFIIITNPKLVNWKLAAMLNIDRIVYWPAISSELSGPLSEYFNCGLEIECGPKNSELVENKLVIVLEDFLKNINVDSDWREKLKQKDIFQVYGSVNQMSNPNKEFSEFEKVDYQGEEFYPLLVGSYQEVACYKMKKINWDQAKSLK